MACIDDGSPNRLFLTRTLHDDLQQRRGTLDLAKNVTAEIGGRFKTAQQTDNILVGNEARVKQLRDVVETIYGSGRSRIGTHHILIGVREGNSGGLEDLRNARRTAGVVQRQVAHQIIHIAYSLKRGSEGDSAQCSTFQHQSRAARVPSRARPSVQDTCRCLVAS